MNAKATLLLLALAVAGVIFLVRCDSARPGSGASGQISPFLFAPPGDASTRPPFERIVVNRSDGRLELRAGVGRRWQVVAPRPDRADTRIMGEFVGMLESAARVQTIPLSDGMKLADFGLEPAALRLEVSRVGSPPVTLEMGKLTPVEGRVYARLGDAREILVVPRELRDLAARPPEFFRDHRVTDVLAESVVKVTLRNPRGEIVLSREDGTWRVLEPFVARADARIVDEWIERFAGFAIRQFEEDNPADLFRYGLAVPRASLRLEVESKSGRPRDPVEWSLGDRADPRYAPNSVYLRFPERRAIFAVPLESEDLLALTGASFRARSLTALNLDFIDRIRLRATGRPELFLGRREEGWELRLPARAPAEAVEVARLVKVLNSVEILEFVQDEEIVARAFAEGPALEVAFAAFTSEPTAEGEAGQTAIATLQFSPRLGNGTRLVRHVEEKLVARVPGALVDQIPLDLLRWRPLQLVDDSAGELLEFEIVAKDASPVVVKADTRGWRAENPALRLSRGRVQTAANALMKLRAVRWLDSAPDSGLEAPRLTVKARFAKCPEAFVLRVGRQDTGGGWFGQIESLDGMVILSEPAVRALTGKLLAEPGEE